MVRINVPVAGPMPVSLQTKSRAAVIVEVDGVADDASFPKARDVCVWTADASFLRTIAGKKGLEWPWVLHKECQIAALRSSFDDEFPMLSKRLPNAITDARILSIIQSQPSEAALDTEASHGTSRPWEREYSRPGVVTSTI